MLSNLERSTYERAGIRQVISDFGPGYIANGFIGFIFAATGPVAIILSVGTRGGLSHAELASWIFGIFFINGLITMVLSWRYRMPLGFAWTIPGTVLVGPALQHLSFPEVIGAYYATGLLIVVMGASGWVKRLMSALPMPIVMGMVAGVFLRFGLDLIRALHSDVGVALPMVIVFLTLSAIPAWGKRIPPVIGALLAGALAIAILGRVDTPVLGNVALAQPIVNAPVWSVSALVELVVPLAITVLVVQNGQGMAVLKSAGHQPPVNTIAFISGVGGILSATVGAVSTCLTGPTNALLTSSGELARQYTAGLAFGMFAVLFGLMAPIFTGLMLAAPKEYIMVIGGLAMLRVLQGAFVAAFGGGKFILGALISLLVTIADIGMLNIGASFWALIFGFLTSWMVERRDYVAFANKS